MITSRPDRSGRISATLGGSRRSLVRHLPSSESEGRAIPVRPVTIDRSGGARMRRTTVSRLTLCALVGSGLAAGPGRAALAAEGEVFEGTPGRDVIVGTQNDDFFLLTAGTDRLDGAAGFDFLSGENAPGRIVFDLPRGRVRDGFGRTDTIAGFEIFRGGPLDDELIGTPGDEQFEGLAGNDRFVGNGGRDEIRYSRSPTGVTVDLAAGTGGAAGERDTFTSVTRARGSAFGDRLLGSDREDFTEQFRPGDGDDLVDGRGGRDRADYTDAPSGVTVDLAAGSALDGFGNRDTLRGVEQVRGSTHRDRLLGDAGNNQFFLSTGNDLVDGRAGSDNVDFFESPTPVTIDLATGTARGTDGRLVRLRGIESAFGSLFADTFVGSAGPDRYDSNGSGDTITGGRGGDQFVFGVFGSYDPARPDTITDFSRAEGDKIELREFAAPLGRPVAFVGQARFSGLGQARFQRVAGGVRLELNVRGDPAADVVAILRGVTSLTVADFNL
jgi:Ca2+-binding RTX toxin-like protein